MIIVDANLLLYAYDPDSPHHDASRRWLEEMLSGAGLVRFTWMGLWAFLRIVTNPRVFVRPLPAVEAHEAVASWLDQPNAGIVEPGDRHLEILGTLLRDSQSTGPLVMDAALAAVAIEHGGDAVLDGSRLRAVRRPRLAQPDRLSLGLGAARSTVLLTKGSPCTLSLPCHARRQWEAAMRPETLLELLQPAPADYRAFIRSAVVLVYFLY